MSIKGNAAALAGARGAGSSTGDQTSNAKSSTTTRRCIACLSPVARHWHCYCRHCRAWLRFGHALRTMRAALREVRT